MPPIPFIGGAYLSRARRFSAQECINLYPERDPTGTAASVAMLVGCPGTALFATVPGLGGMRELYTASTGACFAVRGSGVYELSQTGTLRHVGSLLTATGRVSLADNGTTLVLVDGPYGYLYGLSGGGVVTQILDEAFLGSGTVQFLDGQFVFHRPGTQEIYASPLDPGQPIDALNFQSAETSPDVILSMIVWHQELRIFGTQSIESWVTSGAADFLFSRNAAGSLNLGCAAAASVAADANHIYWLGGDVRGDRVVYLATGYDTQRISTHAIEFALSEYTTIDDAVGWCYQQEGHEFYVLTFPTANATWCYDSTTRLWHRRAFWNVQQARFDRHRGHCHTYVFGKHLLGDWETGQIYEWRLDTYTDNGSPLRVLRSSPHLTAPDLARIAYHRFQLDAETGIGLDGSPITGQTPTVLLRLSNNGGATWGQPREAQLGALGVTTQRIIWERLGMARDRVFEVSSSMPVPQRWVQAHLTSSRGAS